MASPKKRKTTILVLSNSDSGLYDFRKELLRAMLEKGWHVLVSVPETGYTQKLRELGCDLIPTSFERRGMNPAKDLKLLLFYRKLMRQMNPDAVLTYTIKPNIYGGLAATLSGIPYLVNMTGLGTALQGDGMLKKVLVMMYRMGMRKASCVFFQNAENRRIMTGYGCISGKSRVIPGSGVNLEEHAASAYPDSEEPIKFLSLMRLMKDKGIEELLGAAERIHREFPNTLFQILGNYEEETRAQYEPLVQKLEEMGVLKAYGYRDDVPEFMREAHAIVHPSYHEGMSNVLLEAAAAARPVLASAVPGCIDTFEDGISGISFEAKDEESLYRALKRFLQMSREERAEMGENGRTYVEKKFDRNLVVRAYLEELERAGIAE